MFLKKVMQSQHTSKTQWDHTWNTLFKFTSLQSNAQEVKVNLKRGIHMQNFILKSIWKDYLSELIARKSSSIHDQLMDQMKALLHSPYYHSYQVDGALECVAVCNQTLSK